MKNNVDVDQSVKMLPLGDVAEFLDNLRKPVKESARVPGDYPYYGANGIQGTINKFIFDEPLILLAEDGGHFGSKTKPIAYRVDGKCWVNNHAHVLKPKEFMDIGYLHRVLSFYNIFPFISGSTRGKLTKGSAIRIPIPVPPLSEQKRIAAILDKADAIRCKREKAIELTDSFLKSVFLEMFGDPVSNPKNWNEISGAELFAELRYGTSEKSISERLSGTLPVLRIPNVLSEKINRDDLKFVKLTDNEVQKLLLRNGDILFVRTNGNPNYIGRCAVFEGDEPTLFASYLIRARLSDNFDYHSKFLRDLMSFPTYRKKLLRIARTTAGNYNMSTEGLRSLKFVLPPMELQEKYLKIVEKISYIDFRADEFLSKIYELISSLSTRLLGN